MAGIYIHVPFCRSKCGYCAFHSRACGPENATPAQWLAAVEREWARRRRELAGETVSTLYVGGGTPSSLPPDVLGHLLELGRAMAPEAAEVTVEVNPDDVTPSLARQLLGGGVNRVSMGVQSLDDGELRTAGRRHDAAGALRAVECLREAGCRNLSLDLIMGLPGQTPESFERSLRGLLELRPEHLSVYMLQWEPGTPFTRGLREGRLKIAQDDFFVAGWELLCRLAADSGYEHYEISNFALPGRHSRHNSAYWDCRTPYLGLGPGAHSLTALGRSHNSLGLTRWRRIADEESATERLNDLLFTALRTAEGLSLADVAARFGEKAARVVGHDAAALLRAGLLVAGPGPGTLRVPEPHWLVADGVTAALMQ